jgi:hypothetical protein
LIEAVNESFSLFGKSGQRTIYALLEKTCGIRKNDIPKKINTFSEALHQCLGSGAQIIEMHIIEALHEKNLNFKYSPKDGNLVLEEYAESLERFLTQQLF